MILDWYGRLHLYNIKKNISEANSIAKKKPEKSTELFKGLINYLENNVPEKYWPKPNPDYNPESELRNMPFVDIYKAYKEGKNIVEISN